VTSSSRPIVLVPVQRTACGAATLVLARRPDGVRTGLAFLSVSALERAMGVGQRHLAMALPALRGMLADVGVQVVQIDAETVARAAAALSAVS